MTRPPLHVAVCGDRNVADGMAVTIGSTAQKLSRACSLEFHIVDCGLGEDVIRSLRAMASRLTPAPALHLLRVAPERLSHFPKPAGLGHVNLAAYARLFLPEILPDLPRVIYLDSDVLVERDLAPLFQIPLQDRPIAAVRDLTVPDVGHSMETLASEMPELDPHAPYFNSGVLVMDLAQLRKRNAAQLYTQALKRISARLADQSVLNAVFNQDWLPLSPSWNRQIFLALHRSTFARGRNEIWHFTKKTKPWHLHDSNLRGLAARWHAARLSIGWQPVNSPTLHSLASPAKDFVRHATALFRPSSL